ncbi:MAG: 2,3-bisphosphoglycerate-independent phosphoglycerate mutase [Candidatus Peregrinibacteria bacterium]
MRRLCLIILDGFGVAPPGPGNARTLSKMPTVKHLEQEVPNVIMQAAGNAVGLPEGQQGASEPGHLTIGAGRIVWQPLEEINQSIRSGAFFENPVLTAACDRAKAKNGPLHLEVIFSYGGVHGHIDHLFAMIRMAKERSVPRVILHLVGDGRDVPEQQFTIDYDLFRKKIDRETFVKIASLVGRYYAMDRDRQYATRTKVAYDLFTLGKGEECPDLSIGAKEWYAKAPDKEKTDYYIHPLKTKDFQPIRAEDTVVIVNFRSDREIQIVRALEDEHFTEFLRPVRVTDVTCMGPYSDHLPVAFPAVEVKNTLGEVISRAGLKQLRVGETDKFAHITFFFNAQRHEPYPGEERILIESPKVPNFADAPEMSADGVTKTVVEHLGKYDLIIMNYANPDLVGHGGKLDAAIIACETVDRNLAVLLPQLEAAGYDWIITADHGNAEIMLLPDGVTANPSHTASPVQTFVHSSLIQSSKDLKGMKGLKDIAPLCLKIMGIEVPEEMQ